MFPKLAGSSGEKYPSRCSCSSGVGGGAKLDSFNIDLTGLVARDRGVDLSSLSRGELETPPLGISWKVGGNGEKSTFLVAFKPADAPAEDAGDETGGVSVESWPFEASEPSWSASS
jgi:hypothetical protein